MSTERFSELNCGRPRKRGNHGQKRDCGLTPQPLDQTPGVVAFMAPQPERLGFATAEIPMPELQDSTDLRRFMVDRQIRTYDVTDQTLLERFLDVPREAFVPDALVPLAYSDRAIELGEGQGGRNLLAPLVLAKLLQAAVIRPTDRVLDVAGGYGYTAALVSGLCAAVVALEDDAARTARASVLFQTYKLTNASAVTGDFVNPVAVKGPFDLIIVNGGVETGLDPLFALLPDGGRLVAIERASDDPTGRAGKARRYDKIGGVVSSRALFDSVARVLPAFARKPEFVF